MKKFVLFIGLALMLLASINSHAADTGVAGWERNLHVEWGYNPPSDVTVSEFRLYKAGTKICTWTGAAVRSGDCKTTLTTSSTSFQLEAAFTNGQVSPKSAEFVFSDFGTGPAIMILIGK